MAVFTKKGRLSWTGVALLVMTTAAQGALKSLTDNEMSKVSGAGLGFVLQDFKFEHGTDGTGRIFEIGGIKSSQGEDVTITVNKLFIARAGSNYGADLQPVNLGRLVNPYTIDVLNGDNIDIPGKAVLQIAAPHKVDASVGYDCMDPAAAAGSGTCSSRPATADFVNGERPDIGMQMNIKVGTADAHNININAKSAVVDGSYLRLWGDDNRKQLVAQFKLNFYTPELSISSCDMSGGNCGSTIFMRDFALELALGNNLQPMYMDVDGATGNFVFQVQDIRKPLPGEIGADGQRASSNTAAWDFYNDYYTNPDYRSNLRIGDLSVGNKDFGSARLEGMLIQHLKVTTHDLAAP